MTEGAVLFELEGEPERVIKAGESFWEPGGDVIHYQDGNALSDGRTEFIVTMLCAPGQPMLTVVDEDELARRTHLRAPRPQPADGRRIGAPRRHPSRRELPWYAYRHILAVTFAVSWYDTRSTAGTPRQDAGPPDAAEDDTPGDTRRPSYDGSEV